mgnify:CR=1 FL=1
MPSAPATHPPQRPPARRRPGCHARLRGVLRRLGTGLLLVAAAAAGAGELVIAVSLTSLSLPLHVAADKGYFAAEGVAVRIEDCLGGQRCMRRLLDGRAQLATVSDLPVMFHSFERRDYAVIATFVTSTRDLKLVTRAGSGIARAADLTGRRVGTVKGASAQYYLDAYLLYHGIDPARVEVVGLSPEQIPGAFERREVDAVVVWEPYAWLAIRAAGGDARVLPNPRIYTQTFNLVADRRVLAEREDELVRVLRAVERAQQLIRNRPTEAQAIMKARLQLDQSFVDWAWGDLHYRLGLDQSLLSTLENEARWALREGHVQARGALPNVLDVVDSGPLRKALPEAVTVVTPR